MRPYYKHLFLTVKRLLLIMVFMTISRGVFYAFNYSFFAALPLNDVLLHFLYGMRFDLAIVFLFNLLFIFLSVLPNNYLFSKGYQNLLKVVFILVNSLLLGVNFIDIKFYEFEGKRLTADFFGKEWLGQDFLTLLPEFIKDYWYVFLLFFLFVYLLVLLYPKCKGRNCKAPKLSLGEFVKQLFWLFIIAFFSVLAGRGGSQLKPLGIIAAARYTSPQFIPLVLNSPFTVVKTFGDASLPEANYFGKNIVDSIYSPLHHYNDSTVFNKKNIVIIIMESFSREYSGYLNDSIGYTPVLDSIMKQGLTFTNAFANGKRSIEALPSIFSGLPALMDNAFVSTQFASNIVEGIGDILSKKGYRSSFYHGGKNGTMGFDNYVKLVGINNYFGIDEYPNSSDFDGNWGVFDEPYFKYFANELDAVEEPFFSSIFSLSSHHPYKIPDVYKNKFPKGDLINIESIGYADYALGEFFKSAAKSKWFANTLFIITADHTAQSKKEYYKTGEGKYAIPLVLYAPSDTALRGTSKKVCQQADILPTILDYLNYQEPFISFGESVLAPDSVNNSFAINYLSGVYQFITNDISLNFDGESIIDYEFKRADSVLNNPITYKDTLLIESTENKLKAIIQQYNYRIEHNLMRYHGKLSELE